MVEANGPEPASSSGAAQTESLSDQTLAFFDSVFGVVPPVYRQQDKADLEAAQKGAKNAKQGKNGKK